MPWLYITIFIISFLILALAAKKVIDSLEHVAKFLGWKEFVVAFFTVSLGAVAPEFFIGVGSAIHGIPELSFGNIIGQNILLFSFTVGVCALVLEKGIEVESKTVRGGCTLAVAAALLPLLLILDGSLSRADGIVLLLFFAFFIYWFFSKTERFTKVYDGEEKKYNIFNFLKDIMIFLGGFLLIILSAQGIIWSAKAFSEIFALSLPIIGLLIVAIGVGLPETYFSLMLAKKGQSWMILGGLMGAIAISSTLVLGTVALISPIEIETIGTPFFIGAAVFLFLSSSLFLFFAKTRSKISTKEGTILVLTYFAFVFLLAIEIFIK